MDREILKVFEIQESGVKDVINKKIRSVYNVKDADLVIFTGGEDVTPSFYGERAHPTTGNSIARDLQEMRYFIEALKYGKPMMGICRGSQFLCVMNGGKLIQHADGHLGKHDLIFTDDTEGIQISSTHHQQMFVDELPEEEYEVIAYTLGRSNFYENGKGIMNLEKGEYKEKEIVYFPLTNSLCIQGHPEYMLYDVPLIDKINEIINHKLFKVKEYARI